MRRMGRFSITQLMVSVALVAGGICVALHLMQPEIQPAAIALWFAVPAMFFAAFYNLSGRTLRGAKIGLLGAFLVFVLILDAWLIVLRL